MTKWIQQEKKKEKQMRMRRKQNPGLCFTGSFQNLQTEVSVSEHDAHVEKGRGREKKEKKKTIQNNKRKKKMRKKRRRGRR